MKNYIEICIFTVNFTSTENFGSRYFAQTVSLTRFEFTLGNTVIKVIDFFPNWQNSVEIATLQIIGHALLSTNFINPSVTLAELV